MSFYLVTGGAGFIGRHLSRALVRRGDSIRILDDLSNADGFPDFGAHSASVECVRGDAGDYEVARSALAGTDGCFHLAATASVVRSEADWRAGHRANLTSGLNLFRASLERASSGGGFLPIVYASSAATYGASAVGAPLSEDAPQRPLGAYGADKRALELHARAMGATHGVPTAGFRIFNAYGPGQDPSSPYSGVITIFLGCLRRGSGLTIYGDGGQSRDFVHVDDVARFFMAGLEAAAPAGPVWNLCTGRSVSVSELGRLLAERMGAGAPEVRHAPRRLGDAYYVVGSPEGALRALGLRAEVDLESGLSSLIAGGGA